VVSNEDEIEYQAQSIENVQAEKKEEEKKPKYKYLDESSILLLRDLLKPEQISKMRNLLEFENRKDISEKLINNINKVFGL